jgi:agmatinase
MLDSRGGLPEGVPLQWNTFLDTPPEESDPDSARIFVIPVPYDSTTSFKSGARHGPRAIIEASRHLEDYDIELDRDISLVGIHTTPEIAPDMSSPKAMIETVRKAVHSVAQSGRLVALLGGEHTITVGAVQAMAEVYPDLSVLYLDAHADMRDSYMGTKWGHASVARRVQEVCKTVHVGVRSLSEEEMDFIRENSLPVHFWNQGESDISQIANDVLNELTNRVYITVDLDVLDPSIMAAVGAPEPGGMLWHQVTSLLKSVAANKQIVGFDLVELSPAEGPASCAYTAAKLAYKLMGCATQ